MSGIDYSPGHNTNMNTIIHYLCNNMSITNVYYFILQLQEIESCLTVCSHMSLMISAITSNFYWVDSMPTSYAGKLDQHADLKAHLCDSILKTSVGLYVIQQLL